MLLYEIFVQELYHSKPHLYLEFRMRALGRWVREPGSFIGVVSRGPDSGGLTRGPGYAHSHLRKVLPQAILQTGKSLAWGLCSPV